MMCLDALDRSVMLFYVFFGIELTAYILFKTKLCMTGIVSGDQQQQRSHNEQTRESFEKYDANEALFGRLFPLPSRTSWLVRFERNLNGREGRLVSCPIDANQKITWRGVTCLTTN